MTLGTSNCQASDQATLRIYGDILGPGGKASGAAGRS